MNFHIALRKRTVCAALMLLLLSPFACQGVPKTLVPPIVVSPDTPATRELFRRAGRVPGTEIEESIRAGADVDARHDGYTPLMRVVFRVALLDVLEEMTRTGYRSETPLIEKSEALNTLDVLVEAGADIDAPQDADGKNALMILTEWYIQKDFANFEDIFERLLDLGSDPGYRNKEGHTVLMSLADPIPNDPRRASHPEEEATRSERTLFVLERLLQASGSARTTDTHGTTTLMRGFSDQWNFAVVQKLIDAKNKNDDVFIKALDKLKKNRSHSWLADRWLVAPYIAPSHPEALPPLTENVAPLTSAGLLSTLNILDQLMDLGIAPDALRTSDDTALAIAARTEGLKNMEKELNGFLEKLLQRYEWSPSEKNDALLRSVSYQQLNCGRIEVLLHHGANINARDYTGKNVLMLFLTNAYPEQNLASPDLEQLIALGLDVRARDNEGSNLLTLGRYVPLHPEVVKILVAHGIDVNTPNDAGVPPLLAQMREAPGRTFKSIEIPLGSPRFSKYWMCHPEAIRMLLEAGADPNVSDRDGNRPLILSLNERETSKVTTALLEYGADPDVKNADGQTPLMLLALQSSTLPTGFLQASDVFSVMAEKAKMLLDYGADMDVRDIHGKTVWDYAAENEDRRMLRLLSVMAQKHRRTPPDWVTRLDAAEEIPACSLSDEEVIEIGNDGWKALRHLTYAHPDFVRCTVREIAAVSVPFRSFPGYETPTHQPGTWWSPLLFFPLRYAETDLRARDGWDRLWRKSFLQYTASQEWEKHIGGLQ